jgi:hypothetical protein
VREPTPGRPPMNSFSCPGAAAFAPKLCVQSTRYPMVIKLALPPAAAVLMLIDRSVTSHSSE